MSRHARHSAILDIIMDERSVHIDDIIARLGGSAATVGVGSGAGSGEG